MGLYLSTYIENRTGRFEIMKMKNMQIWIFFKCSTERNFREKEELNRVDCRSELQGLRSVCLFDNELLKLFVTSLSITEVGQ